MMFKGQLQWKIFIAYIRFIVIYIIELYFASITGANYCLEFLKFLRFIVSVQSNMEFYCKISVSNIALTSYFVLLDARGAKFHDSKAAGLNNLSMWNQP